MVDAHEGIAEFIDCLRHVTDPRALRGRRHLLEDVLCISLMAMLSGNDDAEAIEWWGEQHEEWLVQFLELPHGIPSQDTILRIFSMLEPKALELALVEWGRRRVPTLEGLSLQLDDKTVRNSGRAGEHPLHVVSVYARELGLVLAQWKGEQGRDSELGSLRDVLSLLSLRGTTVTIDAQGCQRDICETVVERGGHYVLAVKGNQGALLEDIERIFEDADDEAPRAADRVPARERREARTTDAGHGRIEERQITVVDDLSGQLTTDRWHGLQAVARVRSTVTVETTGQKRSQTRYYITSHKRPEPEKLLDVVRGHWAIENNVHWLLDVTMGEDAHKVRDKRAAAAFSALRRYALNLLRLAPHRKKRQSIEQTRKLCAWNRDYLAQVLQGARQLPATE
jgi:predicted transposase YbfD/YdcC